MHAAALPTDPTALDASALSAAIHARHVSCRELMQACLARVARLNPRYNALVSLRPEAELLVEADARDAELARGHSRGWLHGIPQAIKDLANAAGLPTTLGSPLMKDFIAREDGLMAARMKAAGCIVIGKSNTPEFGLGSHTFNELFGTTLNAYDPARSAGGSSGGAAVALALRLLPVADGSDFMGSLRNPAAWNNLFGLRPSQGRVPMWPAQDLWLSQLGTEGPMGRSVRDVARLLATQAGWSEKAPLSIAAGADQLSADAEFEALLANDGEVLDQCRTAEDAKKTDGSSCFPRPLRNLCVLCVRRLAVSNKPPFKALSRRPSPSLARRAEFDAKSVRIGWLADLDGYLPMEAGILDACGQGLARLQALGCTVQPLSLGMAPERVWEAWLVWRRVLVAARIAPLLLKPAQRARIKPEALWEHEQAQACSAAQFMAASVTRGSFYQQMLRLLEHHQVLALPTAQVWPFDAAERWPRQIAGRAMDTYHRWMEVVIYASFAGLPCISVPVGFNAQGLPMGMQLIGRPQGDAALLRLAAAYEQVIGDWLAVQPAVLRDGCTRTANL